jgi:hypothetical protein
MRRTFLDTNVPVFAAGIAGVKIPFSRNFEIQAGKHRYAVSITATA